MDPAAQAALLTQLQTEVQNLQDAAAAATAAAAAAPPAAANPAAPVFALAPALAVTATFLDLTSTNGAKHFKGAIEPLNSKPFDFSDPSDLQVFLDLVLKKSQVWGWNTIFTIPVTDVATGNTANHNLLHEYGMIPLQSVRTQVATYYDQPTKRAQDSFMSCQCLLSSLTLDFLKLITTDSNHYHLPAIVAVDGPVPSGPLLLKLIISQAHVDSRATVSFIRMALTELDTKMIELDSDIEAFNFYVKAQIRGLAARGETSSDLLINLFKGYRAANDVEFLDFIRRKSNAYEEGKPGSDNIGVLMSDSLVKFKARKLVGKWSAPTKEQGQIIALTAQVEQLKTSRKIRKTTGGSSTKTGAERAPRARDNKWAWKDILPQPGEPTTKDFEGKTYHVNCPYHQAQWVCHSPEECTKNPANEGSPHPGRSPGAGSAPSSRKLKAAKLAAAILEDTADLDGESEGDEEV